MVRTSLGGRENEESGSRGGAVHGGRAVRAATVLSVVRTCLGRGENEEVGRGAVGGRAAVGAGSRGGRPVGGGLDGGEDEEVGAGGVGVHFESCIECLRVRLRGVLFWFGLVVLREERDA